MKFMHRLLWHKHNVVSYCKHPVTNRLLENAADSEVSRAARLSRKRFRTFCTSQDMFCPIWSSSRLWNYGWWKLLCVRFLLSVQYIILSVHSDGSFFLICSLSLLSVIGISLVCLHTRAYFEYEMCYRILLPCSWCSQFWCSSQACFTGIASWMFFHLFC
jgi:hypothetical protein